MHPRGQIWRIFSVIVVALGFGCADRGVVADEGDSGAGTSTSTTEPTGVESTTEDDSPVGGSTSAGETDVSSTGSDGGDECRSQCDPLGSDCGRHEACLPWHPRCDPSAEACVPLGRDGEFRCLPDTSPAESIYGSRCEEHGACGRGYVCVPASGVPGCSGAAGCCTSLCPLGEPDRCPGASGGQECVPIHQDPTVQCLDGVGVCLVP